MIVLSVLGLAAAAIYLAQRRENPAPNTPVAAPSRDPVALAAHLQFLTGVEECAWHIGIGKDRSGSLVPGPSSVVLTGYAVLSASGAAALHSTFTWAAADTATPTMSPETRADGTPFPLAGPSLLEAAALDRELGSHSVFMTGRLLLNPDTRVVYFSLEKD